VADEVRYSLQNLIGETAMPVTVKSISLWRKEAENKTGLLAQTLEPLAKAGADLGVVMGYRLPGNEAKAAIEIYPVSGKKVTAAATGTGLAASAIPTLLVEGDNKPGLAHKITQTIAESGADLSFFVAQAIGRRYSAVIGFANDADAKRAATLIKKVAGRK
jgi:hypothetical protein